MAVAFDACTNSGSFAISTASWSHTVTGADTVLLCGVAVDAASDFNPSITYNGVAMTQSSEITTNRYLTFFYLVAPATGTNTVAVSGMPGGGNQVVFAVSLTGVDQSTPFDTPVTSNGSATSVSDNGTTVTGDLLVDFLTINSTLGLAADGSQTVPTNGTVDASSSEHGTSYEAGNGTVPMSWSWTDSVVFAHIVINVNQVSAGGGSVAHQQTTRRLLMGVS